MQMSENKGISSLALSLAEKNFQTYYEHFLITISSELLMSETLVSDVFLGIFVHERES